jgi:hypothetical protein
VSFTLPGKVKLMFTLLDKLKLVSFTLPSKVKYFLLYLKNKVEKVRYFYLGESTRTQPLFGKSFFYRIFCAGHGDPHRKTSLAKIFLLLAASLLEIEIVLSEHAK